MAAGDYLAEFERFAADDERRVATRPVNLLGFARDELVEKADRPKVEAFIRTLYGKRFRKLGFKPKKSDSPADKLLRAELASELALRANDKQVRSWANRQGKKVLGFPKRPLKVDAVEKDLLTLVLAVAFQEGAIDVLEYGIKQFSESQDAVFRQSALLAMHRWWTIRRHSGARFCAARDLRVNEAMIPINGLMDSPDTRAATWKWVKENFDALRAKFGKTAFGGRFTGVAYHFCSTAAADDVETFFSKYAADLRGGPRAIASAKEYIASCAAKKKKHQSGVKAFFDAQR